MRISFVGDVMLGRLVNKALKYSDPAMPWGDTLPLLQTCDMRVCNLECVLSDIGQPWSATPKIFHFRSDEKHVATLHAAKIDMVSIANNHVLDFEYEALQRMCTLLDQEGILHAGAGKNLLEASRPAIGKVRDRKVGFLAFTDNEPGWEATETQPGVCYIPTEIDDRRMQGLLKQVERLRPQVDVLIVSAHWGGNWGYDPPRGHVKVAHALIECGADLIFGHSAHVFRGIEIYKNRPILYSAGDFIDDYAVDEIEKNDESFIFILETELNSQWRLYLYPTCIDQFQAQLAPPDTRQAIFSKMDRLCQKLGSSLQYSGSYAFLLGSDD